MGGVASSSVAACPRDASFTPVSPFTRPVVVGIVVATVVKSADAAMKGAKSGRAGGVKPVVNQPVWRRCWERESHASVCCKSAWGGLGCWEDHRTYDHCCLVRDAGKATVSKPIAKKFESRKPTCAARLEQLHAAIAPSSVAKLAKRVEAEVTATLANYTHSVGALLRPFLDRPSPLQHRILMALVSSVASRFDADGVTYWMHGSTLMGSLRHYGPAPWAADASFGVFAAEAELINASLRNLASSAHDAFGKFTVAASAVHGVWNISLVSSAASWHNGMEPSLSVEWFDHQGQSPAWRRMLRSMNSRPSAYQHHEALRRILPVVRRRPFANLMLPIPAEPWSLLRLNKPADACVCGASRAGSSSQVVPCAILTAALPAVLWNRSFRSSEELLELFAIREAVTSAHASVAASSKNSGKASAWSSALQASRIAQAAIEAVASGRGRPHLDVSVEIAVDVARGAHVVLLAHEADTGRGATEGVTCWRRLHGAHDLLFEAGAKAIS